MSPCQETWLTKSSELQKDDRIVAFKVIIINIVMLIGGFERIHNLFTPHNEMASHLHLAFGMGNLSESDCAIDPIIISVQFAGTPLS